VNKTVTDFGGYIYRYTPVATPLLLVISIKLLFVIAALLDLSLETYRLDSGITVG